MASAPAIVFFAFVAFVAVLTAGRLVRDLAALVRRQKPGGDRVFAVALYVVAVLGLLCILWGWLVEPYTLSITREVIVSSRVRAKVRIVHISDTHCDAKTRLEPRLAAVVNAEKPDLILFTGDAMNSRAGAENFVKAMAPMKARLGKFAIWGNWDGPVPGFEDACARAGFKVLAGFSEEFDKAGEPLTVTGVQFSEPGKAAYIASSLPESGYHILLYHSPDLLEIPAVEEGYDLYLCGHTHGGQVRMPWYGALITLSRHGKKYEMGRYQRGDLTVFVSRGIGMEGGPAPRVRFLCRPEIAVLDVVPEQGR